MLKVMFAITKADSHGFRTLACANHGRHHFDDMASAADGLKALLANNNNAMLQKVYGDLDKLSVSPIFCYDHGDAVATYVKKRTLDTGAMRHLTAWINENIPENAHDGDGRDEISQAGVLHRIVDYIDDHKIQRHEWDWAALCDKIKDLHSKGRWTT